MLSKLKLLKHLNQHLDIYLDDLLNIDNPFFEGIVNRIYSPELQLNKANTCNTVPHFFICIYQFQTDLFHLKFMVSVMTLSLI